ncbi:stalled ribosome rescue protein Dom34 [Rhodoferax ferrireducens]|uniref:Stalled ribosome rescue protein Dom34 n=1 Tax=Rhodoferax ferrireducens TaxID=192843 RepID=A0ABU2C8Q0_9BURK|nr:hypothetical protein [Rhodoferax ferrireducens]MDR7377715.1 stalled ribosome rescue protein Dom34 [Rhodoferax ferrireducens]
MPLFHAVVLTDHQSALVVQFDAEQVLSQRIQAHKHQTAQRNSAVRTEHEFFGEVCNALDGIQQVLVTGSHTATADFKHYAEKHRPLLIPQIVGYEVVDHPTENQLVAMARKAFDKHNLMAGVPTAG